jgi:hypothetical protein
MYAYLYYIKSAKVHVTEKSTLDNETQPENPAHCQQNWIQQVRDTLHVMIHVAYTLYVCIEHQPPLDTATTD